MAARSGAPFNPKPTCNPLISKIFSDLQKGRETR